MKEDSGMVLFREVQRFTQPWLVALVAILAAGIWLAAIAWIFFGPPADADTSDAFIMALVWLLTGVSLPALFFFSRLITEVRADGLYVRFIPYHRGFRRYAWEEIGSSEARRYRPIREYGGWGMRGLKNNKAYNVSGDRGLQLVFTDGRRLLIGSRKAEELAAAVDAARTA